ncbi:MAG: argininosuccinate lyase [Gemmatimonadota bacterium]
MAEKPWGGRFARATDQLMERFNASIGFDCKLLAVDVAGSQAYARALARAGVLTEDERDVLDRGLQQVLEEMSAPGYRFEARLEDIHMAVEARLIELVGPVGGKLHTGRSRNDQVNLDERLYLRGAIDTTAAGIRYLQGVLVASAETHLAVVMPGYTHLQQAQPILFSHYALSLFWMLERDRGRLADAWRRADCLPLGSGALAGSAFPLDRQALARDLGFSGVTANSLDAVSDRDFLAEALAAVAVLLMHLSRFCEDLVVWSSAEFGFVELDDAYATGSSMMPQKKNPDSLELVRGKTGRVYGNLMALLTTMKGVPLTYSKDLQEDKEPVFDSFETAADCLAVFAGAWETMALRPERMAAATRDTIVATDLADYLARKGVPFREAHHVVGRLVREVLERGGSLRSLALDDLRAHSPAFEADAVNLLEPARSLALRNIPGGTGPEAVRRQLAEARAILAR